MPPFPSWCPLIAVFPQFSPPGEHSSPFWLLSLLSWPKRFILCGPWLLPWLHLSHHTCLVRTEVTCSLPSGFSSNVIISSNSKPPIKPAHTTYPPQSLSLSPSSKHFSPSYVSSFDCVSPSIRKYFSMRGGTLFCHTITGVSRTVLSKVSYSSSHWMSKVYTQ